MVNVLTSVFKGKVAELVQKNLNSDFPGYWRYLNGIVSICIGCGLTVIIQSSSVFISTLVPLVGIGLVDLERVFPLALGANIGTTITGILAAFSSPGDRLKDSLQIAFCHTLFNISGILIWYPVPYLRKAPLWLSVTLGKICGQYRWFAIFYILFVFGFTPMVTFGLSLAGLEVFLSVLVPLLLLISFIVVVNVLQEKKPSWIFPSELRTWEFLPKWMRSLQPYDHFVTTYVFCCKCGQPSGVAPIDEADDAIKEIVTMKELEARENEYNEKNEYKF
jgi:sodium-dependent phosphate cotransporter